MALPSKLRYIGTRPPELAVASSRSNASLIRNMAKVANKLVICLDNSGYEVSLERRKMLASLEVV